MTPEQVEAAPAHDPWHGALIDDVCAADAERVLSGETQFVRLAVDHEFCLPDVCVLWPPLSTMVTVTSVLPGVRTRRPWRWLAEGGVA